jgi:hypothetical protein
MEKGADIKPPYKQEIQEGRSLDDGGSLQQADIQPQNGDMEALQKDDATEKLQTQYKQLQAEFTKKSQALAELETKYNSIPKREEIIREYLISTAGGEKPTVMVSSSSAFDLAKEKKPTDFNEAEKLAIKYFKS